MSPVSRVLLFVFAVILLLCCSPASATHFRFGEWIWSVGNDRTVNFTLNVGFRLGYFFSTPPALGDEFEPDSIDFGDNDSLTLTCLVTFVSVELDYVLGTATFSHTYASPDPVVAVWYDSARLSALVNAADEPWQLLTLVTPGIPGSASLSSALPAIVTVTPQANTFVIPTNDPQHTSFRFATTEESYVDYVPAELTLNNQTGRLTWNTNTANFVNGALYAVQVQLMHLNSSGLVDNYAPIDFIIMLSNSTLSAPTFVAPSPAAGTVISSAQYCGNQAFRINATGVTPITISAVGLPLSTADLAFSGGTPVAGQQWTVATITFHPVTALTSNVVTFQATDQQSPPQTTLYSLAFTSTLTDINPPMTTATTQPASLGSTGPVSTASFSLSATDDCSGVAAIHWLLDGATTNVRASSTSFTVNTPGSHTLMYYSTDVVGNNETAHIITFVIGAAGSVQSSSSSTGAAASNAVSSGSAVSSSGSARAPSSSTGAVNRAQSSSSSSTAARVSSSSTGAASSVRGDPQFVGLLGQSFQVHGIDGAVYNLVSERSTQINSRFVFLTSGKCPTLNHTATTATACWSHPGSYMGEISFQQVVDGELHSCTLVSGPAAVGFLSVQVDGVTLQQGEQRSFGSAFSVDFASSHRAVVRVQHFEAQLANSDRFINIEALLPLVPLTSLRSHGLLGQTHSSRVHRNALKYVEGEVDDYLSPSNDMMANDFLFNRFEADKAASQ